MVKIDVNYICSNCETETTLKVPKEEDPDTFVEAEECPECGNLCLEVEE